VSPIPVELKVGSTSKTDAYGLGLSMQPPSVHLAASTANLGKPRVRSTTGKEIQMDLAGVGAMGDAASHASMIMQSRQAKLQRWRPNSAGSQVGCASER
jgi:hypothetical protein